MKKAIILLCSTVALANAALVQFDISPPGSDAAVGLSPSNMVPAVANSTGSGDSISAGVYFDTDTSLLHVAIGYGSAAGFTDLTSPVTAITINNAAPPGSNAPPFFALTLLNFPALDPAKGGVIYGSVFYPTNVVQEPVSNLLAGLHYIVIYTASNPATAGNRDGELRGQLVPRLTTPNTPPTVVCPRDFSIECSGRPTLLSVRVSDPDGDPLTLIWSVNGFATQTNQIPASGPPTRGGARLSIELPAGTNQVAVAVADGTGNLVTCETTVKVIDRLPPVITSATAQPAVLWPPNHRMVEVKVRAEVKDLCDDAGWRITSVTSNEAVDGLGDGDTAPDWEIVDRHTVKLRAERSGTGHGRIYTITLQAKDAAGNESRPKTVRVIVPKSRGYDHGGDYDDDDDDDDDDDKGNGKGKGKENGKGKGKGNGKGKG